MLMRLVLHPSCFTLEESDDVYSSSLKGCETAIYILVDDNSQIRETLKLQLQQLRPTYAAVLARGRGGD